MTFSLSAIALTVLGLFAPALENGGEGALLSKTRQLTFEGRRAGEGYFSADGQWLVFQSEREEENPFYQIYLMDLETGDVQRVSPGHGKTTCAWVHPDKQKVLFASTHLDPEAKKKQKEELDFRASGKERRYSWDYDEHFDLFAYDLDSGDYARLTEARGYDAEGSYSPDGQWIAFASNRHAYTTSLSETDAETFERDKSYMMEIYIMPAAGGEPVRLTQTPGYDGGPFFSPDGKRICWRRFAPDGATAEIFTMNLDGSDQKQLTRLGAMSWAPYYHPSGDYLIFATNLHGFANFELYLVDKAGARKPVRVTETEGFDGLPVFSPDGQTLAWTSNRAANKTSQIFMASWNDAAARSLLGLDSAAAGVAPADLSTTNAGIDVDDLKHHVAELTAEPMAGRLTGTEGERLATEYVASVFAALGLEPAGDDGTFFQEFPFVAGVSLGDGNRLRIADTSYEVDRDWRPLAFSETGDITPTTVAFAGYGIQAPERDGQDEYDAFVHLDVKDKWVLVLRYIPADIEDARRQHLNRYASLRFKTMLARNKGARGLLVATGPQAKVKDELVQLQFDASLAGASIPVISISNEAAVALVAKAGKDLAELQKTLDAGDMVMGFDIDAVVDAEIDIVQEQKTGRNVLARLRGDGGADAAAVAIGAHVDHLGPGVGGSLARDDERGQIHHGADDNASGVAGMLEIAQYLSDQRERGRLKMKHDVLFGAWSGEELGLLGSNYFAENFAGGSGPDSLRPGIAAYLNMDMIGRLDQNVVIQGLGSSPYWAGEIERRNAPIGLPIVTQKDSFLPTDATSFYVKGVPILAAFTGAHSDYHTPRDTAEKLNYEGMKDIARFMGLIARGLLSSGDAPEYLAMTKPESPGRGLRAYLGTVPDYAQGDVAGVKLSGVGKNGPAEKAGVRGGDIIVELAGKKIENIYDYTFAIEAVKVGESTTIVVIRGDERLKFTIVPASRD